VKIRRMAHDVFISYSSKDKTYGDATVAILERRGIRCWMAPRDIVAGGDWGNSIIEGIKASRLMVLIFSAHSNSSDQVKREVERAASYGLAIIPFRIQDIQPSGALEYFLASSHWLDALTPPVEAHLERLADNIKYLLKQGPLPNNPPALPAKPAKPKWLVPVLAAAAVLALILLWHFVRAASAAVDSSLVGTWVNKSTPIPMPGIDFEQRLTIGRDQLEDEVKFHTTGSLSPNGANRFAAPNYALRLSMNGPDELRCSKYEMLLANNLDNDAFNLPTALGPDLNAMNHYNAPANQLIWKRQGGSGGGIAGTWTTTNDVAGFPWAMTLKVSPNYQFDLTAVTKVTGDFRAKQGGFDLKGKTGKDASGTYQIHGDNLTMTGFGSMNQPVFVRE
jgi:hypothetical protein